MTQTEFIEKELKLLDDIKASDAYHNWKRLSKEIEADHALKTLAEERDTFLKKADAVQGEERKKYLSLALEKQKELEENDRMKSYKEAEERIQKIIHHLMDGINKEII